MEAIEATVCRKGSIRQDSAYSGSIIAYGGFAWLTRQRKQIRQVTWQPRTWRLERRNWRLESSNTEHGSWNVEARKLATRKLGTGIWNTVPPNPSHQNHSIKSNRAGTRGTVPGRSLVYVPVGGKGRSPSPLRGVSGNRFTEQQGAARSMIGPRSTLLFTYNSLMCP